MENPVTPVASTLPVVDAPGAPSKTAETSPSISISWAAVTTGAAKYQVRYKTGTDDGTTVEVGAHERGADGERMHDDSEIDIRRIER